MNICIFSCFSSFSFGGYFPPSHFDFEFSSSLVITRFLPFVLGKRKIKKIPKITRGGSSTIGSPALLLLEWKTVHRFSDVFRRSPFRDGKGGEGNGESYDRDGKRAKARARIRDRERGGDLVRGQEQKKEDEIEKEGKRRKKAGERMSKNK